MDALDIDQFFTVGVSTGGHVHAGPRGVGCPPRLGRRRCSALTDMRWEATRTKMSGPHTLDVWDTPDRQPRDGRGTGVARCRWRRESIGGRREARHVGLAVLGDAEWLTLIGGALPEMYTFGVEGYTDNRRADGPGWETSTSPRS